MFNSSLPGPEILQTILQPLLDDFHDWFERSERLLENETLPFLEPGKQAELLERVQKAKQEVCAAQTLLQATEGQAIIEMPIVVSWHQLVSECWSVSIRFRSCQAQQSDLEK